MQYSNVFKNIGRIGIHWYLLFQHHTTLDILRATPDERDLFTITGTGWHFIKYLGPAVVVVGVDTRSERNTHQVSILNGLNYFYKDANTVLGSGWADISGPLPTHCKSTAECATRCAHVGCSNIIPTP